MAVWRRMPFGSSFFATAIVAVVATVALASTMSSSSSSSSFVMVASAFVVPSGQRLTKAGAGAGAKFSPAFAASAGVNRRRRRAASSLPTTTLLSSSSSATEEEAPSSSPSTSANNINDERSGKTPAAKKAAKLTRKLGSQELLMLPRQYGPHLQKNTNDPFPPMCHAAAVVLSATPSLTALRQAIHEALTVHPLLRCTVKGSGEPNKRIDLFNMVREGDPDPCTFVSDADGDGGFGADDVLRIVDVNDVDGDTDGKGALDTSWTAQFRTDLDDCGSWCDASTGPLWRVSLHRLASVSSTTDAEDSSSRGSGGSDTPCALVFSFNHAISDQASLNLLIDELLHDVNAIETTQQQRDDAGDGARAKDKAIPIDHMPMSLEDTVLGSHQSFGDIQTSGFTFGTATYVFGKAMEGLKSPVILPDVSDDEKAKMAAEGGDGRKKGGAGGLAAALSTIAGRSAGGIDGASTQRTSSVQFRTLDEASTRALLNRCREEGVSVTNALTAAAALISSDFIDGGGVVPRTSGSNDDEEEEGAAPPPKQRNYKVLQSLDMRRFPSGSHRHGPLAGAAACDTVSCMAGSMDLMLGPIVDRSGFTLRSGGYLHDPADHEMERDDPHHRMKPFWDIARTSRDQTSDFIDEDGPAEATRVFDAAMTISDMNNLVHLTSQSQSSKGRAYSAGVSNAGVYERGRAVKRQSDENGGERGNLQPRHGKYAIDALHFATSHARTGCLYQVSTMTVDGTMHFTFHPAAPIVNDETSGKYADAYLELLEVAAGTKDPAAAVDETTTASKEEEEETFAAAAAGTAPHSVLEFAESSPEPPSPPPSSSLLPDGALSWAAASLGVLGVALHAGAWGQFFRELVEMHDSVPDAHDFWAAVNFWIFFAVGHPLLQPILWLSDVLHGSPGPLVFDLVPATFLVANIVFIGAVAYSKELRNAVNIAALSAFLTYVGAGLDGQAGLGDFNLQLNDSYQGATVKGCPAYEDVRQPSMNDFDLNKYQGKWYEQKFHDWTQFKEVYDTTLDIKLTSDGKGWTDDFAVKGPAPDAAKLSWDKSPVANGAHYFLFGRVDPNDPPGVLRESGFGVEFPNYIVDVKKDPETGEYTEAIQFQCLERGGVRVFEGINFMSRKPVMSEDELKAMHARAEKAGMYPYGASEEQMHRVARRGVDVDAQDVDNNWQAMWRALGVDKLLELLAESIEDGGR